MHMFICGRRSFGHKKEGKNGSQFSTNSTQKRSKTSRRSSIFTGKGKINKNPYADRGLDKFFALLAVHEEKKQEIYDQIGSENISSIRFVYSSDSEDAKPVVVRVKSTNNMKFLKHPSKGSAKANHGEAVVEAAAEDKNPEEERRGVVRLQEKKEEDAVKRLRGPNGSFRTEKLRHHYYCFAVMLVLVLLFLAIYGRSFAVICTSILWYLVPKNRILEGSLSSLSSPPSLPRKMKPKRNASEKSILQN